MKTNDALVHEGKRVSNAKFVKKKPIQSTFYLILPSSLSEKLPK
jgi:hypothetical protein